jgi:hypothetical protein
MAAFPCLSFQDVGQVGNPVLIGNPLGRYIETADADFQSAADCQSAPQS